MKTWDVVVVGGGIIGLSLALALRRHGAEVLVVERGEPGREASHAAAGMIANADPHNPPVLLALGHASAHLYPQWVHQLEDESGMRVDFRREGTILFLRRNEQPASEGRPLSEGDLAELEPNVSAGGRNAFYVPEASVDPRALTTAALKAAKHRGVEVADGMQVTEIIVEKRHAAGVRTDRTQFLAPIVVNCAGAWASQVKAPQPAPARPVKGHMLAVAAVTTFTQQGSPSPERILLRHVVRDPGSVYLVPRSDGRIVIGSTVEGAGFDKRVLPDTIQRLHQAAANLVPEVGQARMLESWAGLRPGTPDNLPIMGETRTPGYYVCTGHYRDGILLAPISGEVMAQVIRGMSPEHDISAFSPQRFK